jgi:hypothetical protein
MLPPEDAALLLFDPAFQLADSVVAVLESVFVLLDGVLQLGDPLLERAGALVGVVVLLQEDTDPVVEREARGRDPDFRTDSVVDLGGEVLAYIRSHTSKLRIRREKPFVECTNRYMTCPTRSSRRGRRDTSLTSTREGRPENGDGRTWGLSRDSGCNPGVIVDKNGESGRPRPVVVLFEVFLGLLTLGPHTRGFDSDGRKNRRPQKNSSQRE